MINVCIYDLIILNFVIAYIQYSILEFSLILSLVFILATPQALEAVFFTKQSRMIEGDKETYTINVTVSSY